MAAKPLPSQRLLRRLFDFNPEDGSLIWRHRPRWMFAAGPGQARACKTWNSRYAGTEAGVSYGQGYRSVRIFGETYLVHRVCWKWAHGNDPVVIDHADRNPANNRLTNLCDGTQQENCLNRRFPIANTTGAVGVTWHKRRNHWVVELYRNGRNRYIGSFPTFEAAVAARAAAETRFNGHHSGAIG